MKDIRQALQERKIFNNALQKKYDSLKEYSDKLEFIFNILTTKIYYMIIFHHFITSIE